MDKLIIKVTLNPDDPVEAELISILKDKKNRAEHLKMAALHFWKILGKTEPDTQPSVTVHTTVKSGMPTRRENTIHNAIDFRKTFENF
jgi:hypothetical protein